jgi:glycosyltransferase involved in cell wall biosynthesis
MLQQSGKRVVHVITRLDMGGSAQNTLDSCIGLAEKGYRITLVYGSSYESEMTESESGAVERMVSDGRANGVSIVLLDSLIRKINPIKDLRVLVSLWRLFLKERPDIVHTHTSKAGILGRIAAWAARVPVIIHTPHGHVFFGHFNPIAGRVFLIIEKIASVITDKLVSLTQGEQDDYIRLSVADVRKHEIIHSGIALNRFQCNDVDIEGKKVALGLPVSVPVVGTVGWLLPIKGPRHLLDAMKLVWGKNIDTHLVYVGKGPLMDALKNQVTQIGAQEKVTFLGWRNDIDELMPVFDIFVLPSLNEGMGRVVAEAMAAGKPVVASRVGGIPDMVVHGQSGILVPPGNEKKLADGIMRLLDNPGEADRMGKAGKELCRSFSRQAMIEKIDRLYQSMTNYNG